MIDPSPPEPFKQLDLDFRPPAATDQKYGASSDGHQILQQRWEILEPLGQGGIDTVYKARALRL